MSAVKKYKTLTLKQKAEIIRAVEAGGRKKTEIAKEYGIPLSTLSTYLKNKEKILKSNNDGDGKKKRVRGPEFPDIEECVLTWFRGACSCNIPIGGQLIRAKAEEFGKMLGNDSFKSSAGWLERFADRNELSFKRVCGERASVVEIDVQQWNEKLNDLLKDYAVNNIFNVDELGLFFRCTPDRTYTLKADPCFGGKKSKERVTILVGANMDGSEKLPLLMIGKAARPRCFKNMKTFPVEYTANKKAWMTSVCFEKWVRKLDIRFHQKNRKVILFVDNCSAHPEISNLKAINLQFFPPNMTSMCQPMDQGVIRNLKHNYRKLVVNKILDDIYSNLSPSINLLDANRMILKAWKDVKNETIANCFKKAGFSKCEEVIENAVMLEENVTDENEPERWNELATIPFSTFVAVDDDIIVTSETSEDDIVAEVQRRKGEMETDEREESDDEEDSEQTPFPDSKEALKMISGLQSYFEAQENIGEEIFDCIGRLEESVRKIRRHHEMQTKITSFFSSRQ